MNSSSHSRKTEESRAEMEEYRGVRRGQGAVGSLAEEVQEVPLLGVGGRDVEDRQAGRTKKGWGRKGWRRVNEDPGKLQRASSRAGPRIPFFSFSTPPLFISLIFKDFLNNNSKFV